MFLQMTHWAMLMYADMHMFLYKFPVPVSCVVPLYVLVQDSVSVSVCVLVRDRVQGLVQEFSTGRSSRIITVFYSKASKSSKIVLLMLKLNENIFCT